jgi:hypothetical protein
MSDIDILSTIEHLGIAASFAFAYARRPKPPTKVRSKKEEEEFHRKMYVLYASECFVLLTDLSRHMLDLLHHVHVVWS